MSAAGLAIRACAICGGRATVVDESPSAPPNGPWCHQHEAGRRPHDGFKRVRVTDRKEQNR